MALVVSDVENEMELLREISGPVNYLKAVGAHHRPRNVRCTRHVHTR